MNDMQNLVEKLARSHKVTVMTDDGIAYATEDGLLQQLRDAIHGDAGKNGGTSNKSKLPMNAPALDLMTLIDRQIAEVWAAVTGRVPNADKGETLLIEWASAVRQESLVTISSPEMADGQVIWTRAEYTPEGLMERWVQQILDLFDPPRTAEILAACIACGERELWRTKDGETVKQSALIFVRDRETGNSTEARCLACGVSWMPSQFLYLAEAITDNEARHAHSGGMTVG